VEESAAVCLRDHGINDGSYAGLSLAGVGISAGIHEIIIGTRIQGERRSMEMLNCWPSVTSIRSRLWGKGPPNLIRSTSAPRNNLVQRCCNLAYHELERASWCIQITQGTTELLRLRPECSAGLLEPSKSHQISVR
jgi:hypothetical protein